MTSLYHLRSASPRDTYRITKLDSDYSIEASYLVSKHECTCPAGARDTCRHRQMLPFFLAKAHIDNGWMLDWHTRQWRKPLCEDGREQPIDEVRSQEDQYGRSPMVQDLIPAYRALNERTAAVARSQEDLASATERSQASPLQQIGDNWREVVRAATIKTSQIEEPVPPTRSSLEAEVERPRGPAPAPSASPPSGMKRRKI